MSYNTNNDDEWALNYDYTGSHEPANHANTQSPTARRRAVARGAAGLSAAARSTAETARTVAQNPTARRLGAAAGAGALRRVGVGGQQGEAGQYGSGAPYGGSEMNGPVQPTIDHKDDPFW